MSLNIKNPDADRLASDVSELAGESKTAAVINALKERRERLRAERRVADDVALTDDVLAIAAKIRARLHDDGLHESDLYDSETGLPT